MTPILSSGSFVARTFSACRRFRSSLLTQGLLNGITLRPASATSATSDIHDGSKQFDKQINEQGQTQSSASNKEFEKVRRILFPIFLLSQNHSYCVRICVIRASSARVTDLNFWAYHICVK